MKIGWKVLKSYSRKKTWWRALNRMRNAFGCLMRRMLENFCGKGARSCCLIQHSPGFGLGTASGSQDVSRLVTRVCRPMCRVLMEPK